MTFTSGVGNITRQLTVSQEAGGPQEYTINTYPSSYVSDDSSFSSISNESGAHTSADSTTRADILMNTGGGAESYIYFKFDLSSIPSNATIDSVSCAVKTNLSAGTAVIPTANVCLYSGTTAKGSPISARGNTSQTNTLSGETWTRVELDDIRVRFYAKRAANSTTQKLYMRFFGATLTVKYTI